MSTDYEKAKELGLTSKNRWEEGIEHHPESEKLFEFIETHDLRDNDDYFCWKSGGDGDNGEFLMYLMDAYFELKELESKPKPFNPKLLGLELKYNHLIGYPKDTKLYQDNDDTVDLIHMSEMNVWSLYSKPVDYGHKILRVCPIEIPDHDFGVKLISQFLKGDK